MTSTTVTNDTSTDPRITRSRAKILDAATELLVEGGSRAVTVDAVAERSGVAKSTMYRHFPSRADLLVEVLKHNMPEIDPPVPGGDFETALRSMVHSMASALAQPGQERIVPALMALKNTDPDVAALAERERGQRVGLVEEILAQGIAEGVVADDIDIEMACTLLVGPLMFAMLTGGRELLPEVADTVADQFISAHRPARVT